MSGKPEAYDYELNLGKVLKKLKRAYTKKTGTRMSWEEVQTLLMEFYHDFDEVEYRTIQATKGYEP